MGDLDAPELLVILEGEWDAVSFFAACGWFHDAAFPGGVAVFGMRGSGSVGKFLAAYGSWLKINRPAVLLMDVDWLLPWLSALRVSRWGLALFVAKSVLLIHDIKRK